MKPLTKAMAAGLVLLSTAAPSSSPRVTRSGRFADRPTGMVGLDRAVANFGGDTIASPRNGDVFQRFTARDFGTRKSFGLIKIIQPTSGLVIRDVTAERGYRFLDVFTRRASLTDSVVERVRASGLIRGFARIRADSHDVVIRDVDARFRAEPASAPELPVGIGLEDTAHDILIERTVMRGARMVRVPDRYTNGDGYSTERGNARITFRRAEAHDATDGGFDLKSTETRLEDTLAAGNGRNYRFWGTGTATAITSRDPENAHVWLGKGARWRIARLVVRSRTQVPVIRIGPGATLIVDSHDVQVPAGTRLVVSEDGGGTVRWGRNGAPRIAPAR